MGGDRHVLDSRSASRSEQPWLRLRRSRLKWPYSRGDTRLHRIDFRLVKIA